MVLEISIEEKVKVWSEKVVGRKMNQIEKLMETNERKERKRNIIIRGLHIQEPKGKEEIEKFFGEELGVKCGTEWVKIVGKQGIGVIQVRLKKEEDKEEVMRNKKRLENKRIYIDYDLTRKERETQWEMVQWAKVERGKGRNVKIGYHKLRMEDKWISWQAIKNEKVDQDF